MINKNLLMIITIACLLMIMPIDYLDIRKPFRTTIHVHSHLLVPATLHRERSQAANPK